MQGPGQASAASKLYISYRLYGSKRNMAKHGLRPCESNCGNQCAALKGAPTRQNQIKTRTRCTGTKSDAQGQNHKTTGIQTQTLKTTNTKKAKATPEAILGYPCKKIHHCAEFLRHVSFCFFGSLVVVALFFSVWCRELFSLSLSLRPEGLDSATTKVPTDIQGHQ